MTLSHSFTISHDAISSFLLKEPVPRRESIAQYGGTFGDGGRSFAATREQHGFEIFFLIVLNETPTLTAMILESSCQYSQITERVVYYTTSKIQHVESV